MSQSTPVKSAVRVLDIFEYFAARRRPATIQEVASALDYPHSSATTLLNSLRDRGYLIYDPVARTYLPALRLLMLSRWLVEEPTFTGNLTASLNRIQQATNETVILAAREGGFARYVQVISSGEAIRLFIPSGTLRPLHRTATGIMLLSALDEQEREVALDSSLALDAEASRQSYRQQAYEDIQVASRQGWFLTRGSMTAGAGVVAALLPSLPEMERMAIGVAAPLPRLETKLEMVLSVLDEVASSRIGTPSEARRS